MANILKISLGEHPTKEIAVLRDYLSDNNFSNILEITSDTDKAIIEFDGRKFKRVKTDIAFQPCYGCAFLKEGFKCSQSMNLNIKCWVGNDKYYIYKEVKK